MPSDSSSYKELRDLNDKNYMLDLSAGTRLYLRNRLHDRGRKIRSCTPFFRPDGILPVNGLIRKKVKPISIRQITQLTE
jgi:hypothetical protein